MRAACAARGQSLEVDSAGTGGWHEGEPPDARMTKAAAKRGIDLSTQRARQVRPEDFSRFDYVLAMDRQNLANLQEIYPTDAPATLELFLGNKDVPDPYYGGPEGFETVLDLVEHGAEVWLDRIAGER